MEKNQKYIDQKRDYNSKLSTFQISKELHKMTKDFCKKRKIKVRDFLEAVISNSLNEN